MKILVLGAGVIGTTYAWQLSQAGADVTLWIRPERKDAIEEEGLRLDCIDLRHGRRVINTMYRPAVLDTSIADDGYDLILVSVSADKLEPALELLSMRAGNTDVLFFQNTWVGPETFNQCLNPDQYFFGYPFKAGGGRDAQVIRSVIFGHHLAATLLGEKDGQFTPRLRRIHHLLAKAEMAPQLSRQIIPYLWTHYVWAAATIGAYMKAGSFEAFVDSPRAVRESFLAMREGFTVFDFPLEHRRTIRTTNSLERINKEIRRRTRVVGVFPNEASCLRLVSALLMETSEEWQIGKHYCAGKSFDC